MVALTGINCLGDLPELWFSMYTKFMDTAGQLPPGQVREFRLSLERMVNLYNKLERRPLDFGTGELLHPSEIHLIEAVDEGRGLTVTALAGVFGITKGAVSQLVTRLEHKGYLLRRPGRNDKEVLLELTGRGRTAALHHAALHRRMDAALGELMSRVDPGELAVLGRMLDRLGEVLAGWARELDPGQAPG